MENCSANTERCIFRTTRCITRNFISHRAILGFRRGQQRRARSACASAGTNGIPKRRACRRYTAQRLFFIPQQSAGTLRKRRSSAQRNIPPGKRSSAVTQSRMAAISRCQTAAAMKRLRMAMVLNFGDKVLFADQTAKSSQKVPSIKKRSGGGVGHGAGAGKRGRRGSGG